MAQLVEQRIRNAWVTSSSLVIGSKLKRAPRRGLSYCGNSSVGRAAASQAAGHEFEPRLPLILRDKPLSLVPKVRVIRL